jgi:hypothetical protein
MFIYMLSGPTAVHDGYVFGPPRSTTYVFRTPALYDGCVSDPRVQRQITKAVFGYTISKLVF